MSRERKGTVQYIAAKANEKQGHYACRYTADDGSRPWIHLDHGPKSDPAKEKARDYIEGKIERGELAGIAGPLKRAKRGASAMAVPAEGETFAAWFERWCKDREARGTPARDQRGHFKKWIEPRLGARAVATLTRRDVEEWVEWIDGQVREGKLSAKTAANAWGTMTKSLRDAAHAKTLALRVLGENIARDVEGPDDGIEKSKAWLWPSEFLALVKCDRIPIRWRRLFALAIYTYTRPGELEALEWEDVDLEHGVIHVHRAIDRTGDGVKETKTNNPRRIPIESALRPLLQAMRDERDAEGKTSRRVITMPPECDLAARLRKYVDWAGVKRAELTANDATRKQLRFYDLRATGITWMAIRGDDPLRIKQRAGHGSFSTTEGYIRAVEDLGSAIGNPFPTLPEDLSIVPESSENPTFWGQLRESYWKEKRPQRDSNPR